MEEEKQKREQDDLHERVKVYFGEKKSNNSSILWNFIGGGIFCGFVLSMFTSYELILLVVGGGLLGVMIGGGIAMSGSSPMTDGEYDALVKNRIADITKEKALSELGLDEDQVKEIAPVCFEGYNFAADTKSKIREDLSVVSSCYRKSWLFFSDNQLYTYSHDYHFDKKLNVEKTQEFFYKDVTSVFVEKRNGKPAFELTVPSANFYAPMENTEENANIVQAMKQKLREKKQA